MALPCSVDEDCAIGKTDDTTFVCAHIYLNPHFPPFHTFEISKGLTCYNRDGFDPVPGCDGVGEQDFDYCI